MSDPLNDPHRPRFHFTPGRWMNDSIPFFWNGEYHYFFLHNTAGVEWSALTAWGHAVSRDLVHWTHLPDAFAPTPGGPDRDGCWTGCVVEAGGTFYAFYTAIPDFASDTQRQCLATSVDLIHWEKYPDNPLPVVQPSGFGQCFRDPMVWREGDGWNMIVGGELPDHKGGAVFAYHSLDLLHWEYQGPLCVGDAAQTGSLSECPDFFRLGDTSTLLTSSDAHTWWQTGAYEAGGFRKAQSGPTDTGAFYAAKTLLDDRGRRLLLGWVQETRPAEEQTAAGWSGCLSLPRHVTARPNGTPHFAPVPEMQALRGRHWHWDDLTIPAGGLTLDGIDGDSLEIVVRLAPAAARRVGLTVRCSPDGLEETPQWHEAGGGGELTLHLFLDRSVVETFVGGRVCLTQRTYPVRADSLGVRLLAEGGTARALSVDVWALGGPPGPEDVPALR